jgi:hypothetical protein
MPVCAVMPAHLHRFRGQVENAVLQVSVHHTSLMCGRRLTHSIGLSHSHMWIGQLGSAKLQLTWHQSSRSSPRSLATHVRSGPPIICRFFCSSSRLDGACGGGDGGGGLCFGGRDGGGGAGDGGGSRCDGGDCERGGDACCDCACPGCFSFVGSGSTPFACLGGARPVQQADQHGLLSSLSQAPYRAVQLHSQSPTGNRLGTCR